MSANYRNPNWLLPNELNQSINPSLSESRKSLYSMNFDGTNDYIDCGNDSSLNISGDLSISAWVYIDAHKSYNAIISKIDATNRNYEILVRSTANISFYTNNGAGGSVVRTDSTTTIATNTWTHVAVVVNSGVSDGTKLYFNGVEDATKGTHTIVGQTNNLYIGQRTTGSFNFNGKIDEVAIWNKALSATEVAALSTANAPANLMALSAKPIAYYPLGEFAGNSGELGGTPSGQTNSWKFPNQAIKDYVFDFDGGGTSGGDYITLSSNMLANKSKFSWSGWIKFSSYPSSPTNIYGAGNGYAMQIYRWQNKLLLQVSSGNSYSGSLPHDIYELQTNTSSPFNSSAPSKWYHIAIAWQGNTTSGVKAWVDGVETNNSGQNTTISNLYNGTANWDLGNRANGSPGPTRFFDGQASNVLLWDELIDNADVQTLYNNGSPLTGTQPKESDLLFWWKLNAATSSYNPATSTWTITDSAGSNNGTSTTLSSTSLIPSDLQFESPYSNFSLDFDGTSSYLNFGTSIGDSLGDNYSGGISVSLWFKAEVTNGDDGIFGFTNGTSTPSGYGPISAVIYVNKIQLFYGGANKEAEVSFTDTTSWHHLVATFDTDLTGQLYLDNSPVGSSFTYDPTNADFIGTSFYVGNYYKNLNNRFNGKIDEVALWKSSLTAAQVNQVYNSGRPGDLTSLSPISWSRLGEDASFVNNNITIPNQISGGPTGTGSGTQTAMLSADAPQSYGGGHGVGLAVTDKIGDAPNSTANSLSYNMIPDNRHTYIPGYVPAKVDNAFSMSFDAASDNYMLLPGSAFSASASDFSISFWYFRSSNPSGHETVIYKASNFEIYQHSNGQAFWTYFGGVSSNTNKIPIVLNGWKHVCYVVTSTGFKGYQNGSLVAENTFSSTPNYGGSSNPMYFGGQQSLKHSNMKLDEIAFFDYALTAKQIKEDIYNASTTGKTADLSNNSNLTAPVAWYRMGD